MRTYLDNPMSKRGTEDTGAIPSLTRRVKIGKFSSAARLNDTIPYLPRRGKEF